MFSYLQTGTSSTDTASLMVTRSGTVLTATITKVGTREEFNNATDAADTGSFRDKWVLPDPTFFAARDQQTPLAHTRVQ